MSVLSAAFAAYGADPIAARRQFKALALDGDPRAQAAYALMLAAGQGGGTDPAAAVLWYHRAADQAHAVACYALAGMILEGRGVEADPALARQWYERAAELGDRDALWMLGSLAADPEDALRSWRLAAARGHAGALTSMGRALLATGAIGEGAEALLEAATAGDEDALTELARVLQAVRAAADRDSAAAWVAAAFTDDPGEADALVERAVAAGHGRACLKRAAALQQTDPDGAWALIGRAAEAGSPDAQHELATRLATGEGRDPAAAAAWFREAARFGRPASLRGRGAALLESGTTEEDQQEARSALHEAAMGGDEVAMFLYAAQVTDEDRIEALRWLIEAADAGHAGAADVAKQLAATLTPDDVRQADRATRTDGSFAEGLAAR